MTVSASVADLTTPVDRFLCEVYWSETDNLTVALTDAIESWVAAAVAEHDIDTQQHQSGDSLGTALVALVAAVQALASGPRSDLTTPIAISEALADWIEEQRGLSGVA